MSMVRPSQREASDGWRSGMMQITAGKSNGRRANHNTTPGSFSTLRRVRREESCRSQTSGDGGGRGWLMKERMQLRSTAEAAAAD